MAFDIPKRKIYSFNNIALLGEARHQELLSDYIANISGLPYIQLGNQNVRTTLFSNQLMIQRIADQVSAIRERQERFMLRFYKGIVVIFSLLDKRMYWDIEGSQFGYCIDFGEITQDTIAGLGGVNFLNGDANIGAFCYVTNDETAKIFLYCVTGVSNQYVVRDNKRYFKLQVKSKIEKIYYKIGENDTLVVREYNFYDLYQNYKRITSYRYFLGSHVNPIKIYLYYDGNPYIRFDFTKLKYIVLGLMMHSIVGSYNNNFNRQFAITMDLYTYFVHFGNHNTINNGWYPLGIPGLTDEMSIYAVGGQNLNETNLWASVWAWSGWTYDTYNNGTSHAKWFIMRDANHQNFNHVNTTMVLPFIPDIELITYEGNLVGVAYLYHKADYDFSQNLGSWSFNRFTHARLMIFSNFLMNNNGIWYSFYSLDKRLYTETFVSNNHAMGTYGVVLFIRDVLGTNMFTKTYASHIWEGVKPRNINLYSDKFVQWARNSLRFSTWDEFVGVECHNFDRSANKNHTYIFNNAYANRRGTVYFRDNFYESSMFLNHEKAYYHFGRPDKMGGGFEIKVGDLPDYPIVIFAGDICNRNNFLWYYHKLHYRLRRGHKIVTMTKRHYHSYFGYIPFRRRYTENVKEV